MHPSGGVGTPLLLPKSKIIFKKASTYLFKILAADFVFKYFYYSGHCADRVANLCKSTANAPFRDWGTPLLQPKSNITFKKAFTYLFKILAADFVSKSFYYSGHCAHRVANLCKSTANATFRV